VSTAVEPTHYLTVTEVVRHLRVSRPIVLAMIESGQLKALKLAKRIVRVERASLERLTQTGGAS
jgi:excisionase family DNA binding protein